MVSFGETSSAHSIDYVSNLKSHSAHDGQLVKAVPLTQSPEQGQLVTRLENVLKELGGCQSSEEIQKVTEENDLLNSLPGVAKSLKDAEMAMKADGQTVKANRISKMRKLLRKIPAQKPRKQRKTLREILRLAQKNVGITLQKGGLCGSGLCGVPCITGTAIAVTGAVALIAIASAGLFDAPDLSAQVEADVGAEEVEVDNELDVDNAEGEAEDAAKQSKKETRSLKKIAKAWKKATNNLEKLEKLEQSKFTGNDDAPSGRALEKLTMAKKKAMAALANYITLANGEDDLMKPILVDFFSENEDTIQSFKSREITENPLAFNVKAKEFFTQHQHILKPEEMRNQIQSQDAELRLEAAKFFYSRLDEEISGVSTGYGWYNEKILSNVAEEALRLIDEAKDLPQNIDEDYDILFKEVVANNNLKNYPILMSRLINDGLGIWDEADQLEFLEVDVEHAMDAIEKVNGILPKGHEDDTGFETAYSEYYLDYTWFLHYTKTEMVDEEITSELFDKARKIGEMKHKSEITGMELDYLQEAKATLYTDIFEKIHVFEIRIGEGQVLNDGDVNDLIATLKSVNIEVDHDAENDILTFETWKVNEATDILEKNGVPPEQYTDEALAVTEFDLEMQKNYRIRHNGVEEWIFDEVEDKDGKIAEKRREHNKVFDRVQGRW